MGSTSRESYLHLSHIPPEVGTSRRRRRRLVRHRRRAEWLPIAGGLAAAGAGLGVDVCPFDRAMEASTAAGTSLGANVGLFVDTMADTAAFWLPAGQRPRWGEAGRDRLTRRRCDGGADRYGPDGTDCD